MAALHKNSRRITRDHPLDLLVLFTSRLREVKDLPRLNSNQDSNPVGPRGLSTGLGLNANA